VANPRLAADPHVERHAAARPAVGEGEALREETRRVRACMVGRGGHAPHGEYGLSITTRPRAWAPIVTVAVRPGNRIRGILYDPCSP
jgi:hypothetical protein